MRRPCTVDEEQQEPDVAGEPTGVKPLLRGIPDLLATILALPAIAYLISSADGSIATLSAALFGIGLLAVLGMSAVYHAPNWGPRWMDVMRRFDHAAIFLLIAGSYTPFCLCTDIPLAVPTLVLAWVLSGIGALRCLLLPESARGARTLLYVLLGLVLLPSVPALYTKVGPTILTLCVVGGALYIFGAGIYMIRRPNPFPRHFGYHEVFHLFVFAAAGCHYVAVWEIVASS